VVVVGVVAATTTLDCSLDLLPTESVAVKLTTIVVPPAMPVRSSVQDADDVPEQVLPPPETVTFAIATLSVALADIVMLLLTVPPLAGVLVVNVGGVVSILFWTVTETSVAVPTLPAASFARAASLYVPSGT